MGISKLLLPFIVILISAIGITTYLFELWESPEIPYVSMGYDETGYISKTFDYNSLRNIEAGGGTLAILDFTSAQLGECKARIDLDDHVVQAASISVENLSPAENEIGYLVNGTLTVKGLFLNKTPKSESMELITSALKTGYRGVMDCYKHRAQNATLLE